jgi:hypothetical protein
MTLHQQSRLPGKKKKNIMKGMGKKTVDYLNVLCRHLAGGTEKNHGHEGSSPRNTSLNLFQLRMHRIRQCPTHIMTETW